MDTNRQYAVEIDGIDLSKFIDAKTTLLCGIFGVDRNGIPMISSSDAILHKVYNANFLKIYSMVDCVESKFRVWRLIRVQSRALMRYMCAMLMLSYETSDGILSSLKFDNVKYIIQLVSTYF